MPLFLDSESVIEEWLSCKSDINSYVSASQKTCLSAHPVDKKILLSSNANAPEVCIHFDKDIDQLTLF
jgi:hypothetical protein